jgi:hypothetical protein
MDLDTLKLESPQIPPTERKKPERYLRGPIPMRWIISAGELAGSSLLIGMVLWHFRSLRKNTELKIGIEDLSKFCNIHPDTVRRAINGLEDAGLISVERKIGCKNLITLRKF